MAGKSFIKTAALILISFAVCADNHQSSDVRVMNTWTDENGSSLTIETVSDAGLINGYYISKEPGWGCQNTRYPVIGWVYNTVLTFSTRWSSTAADCQSVTTWTGLADGGRLLTSWQHLTNGNTSLSQVVTGTDTFTLDWSSENESLDQHAE